MKIRLKNVFSGFVQKVNNGMNSLSMVKLRTTTGLMAAVAAVQGSALSAFAGSDLEESIGNVQKNFITQFAGPISRVGLLFALVGLVGIFLTQDKKREVCKSVAIGGVAAFILFMGGDSCIASQIITGISNLKDGGGKG